MSALILVADADPFDLRLLSELCSSLGYEVVTAGDGGAVLDAVARHQPQLLLMDVDLPELDGFQVLRILRGDPGLGYLPVLLVTAADDEEAPRRGLEMGAEDYVTKPFRTFEIQQRLRNLLRARAIETTGSAGPSLGPETIDSITGAGTTSQLHISLDYEFTRAVRYAHPLSCVVVHCANYRQIAGELGGSAAQPVLETLASELRNSIRGVDQLFRSGPDEFTILLPETDRRGCKIVVERVRAATGAERLFPSQIEPRPRIEVGAASYRSGEGKVKDGEALWQRARGKRLAAGADRRSRDRRAV